MNAIYLKGLSVLSSATTFAFACCALYGASERVLIGCLFASNLAQIVMNLIHYENAANADNYQTWLLKQWQELNELTKKPEA